ncbi:AAA family ATPase [Pseudochrobactrum sp. Wa41.01b-1]|uniref:ATP-dependent nuclease n=1 Tax=Pseudochrobactrum sp. Wa41.01b-1 TaxID=2864102 RepID=UPI001C68965D|nr:AAA family ATPase [Pseudochrobactrum sp. Wa41.01b-1]QYM72025.1 AAA family ATPase [Pseudochrobactrum sp. Wa41.01b-1]
MYLKKIDIKNFRRLKDIKIDFEAEETVFVGPNNSGKTSSTAAIRSFLGNRNFKIHDFSLCSLTAINTYSPDVSDTLPCIQLDLWFHIDPNKIEFGTVFALATDFSGDFSEIGIRCSLEAEDVTELWGKYDQAFPLKEDLKRKKTLVDFLALEENLRSYFKIKYYSLQNIDKNVVTTPLDPNEGKQTLRSLLRVDFVDAQRNIDDENAARSNKLSEAFTAYYQRNLEQAEVAEAAIAVIEENNRNLTTHYNQHFQPLMNIIADLGLPSQNDRAMKIVSTLSSEAALRGSSELFYVDTASTHELPEAYNGLGFKNLVFMAIQIDNFYKQWLATEENRPLCQMIFIEEPEVHLHAQVQQTFIKQMWKVLTQGAEFDTPRPQLIVTTHSSHVLDAVDFSKIRYFRRVDLDDVEAGNIYSGSIVKSLKEFQPEAVKTNNREVTTSEALAFLKKYLRLTHCDLFFADAVILVEGAVEKLLLPKMIDQSASGLNSKYLTILEVGGAYSMRFANLMEFLGLPYLIITDIDSVDPNNNRKGCKATDVGAVTSNASIKYFFDNCELVSDLAAKDEADHIQANNMRFVTYQKKIEIDYGGTVHIFHGRTLEETFVYENHALFSGGALSIGEKIPSNATDFHDVVWKRIKSSTFKKTEFAMNVLTFDTGENEHAPWVVPHYIAIGLRWLEKRLTNKQDHGGQNA